MKKKIIEMVMTIRGLFSLLGFLILLSGSYLGYSLSSIFISVKKNPKRKVVYKETPIEKIKEIILSFLLRWARVTIVCIWKLKYNLAHNHKK